MLGIVVLLGPGFGPLPALLRIVRRGARILRVPLGVAGRGVRIAALVVVRVPVPVPPGVVLSLVLAALFSATAIGTVLRSSLCLLLRLSLVLIPSGLSLPLVSVLLLLLLLVVADVVIVLASPSPPSSSLLSILPLPALF